MVSSLTNALNTANSAIRFSQNALSVVSNNVANANTVGYTRQVIVAENQVIAGEGSGVSSGTVIRYSDQALQSSVDQQNSKVQYYQTISDYYATIESQFGKLNSSTSDTSSNLDEQISDMYTQLNNLIQDPLSASNRVTFKNSTVQTVDRLNKLATDLSETQLSIDDDITTDLETINTALKNISDLNYQIGESERSNGNSSDLQDLRQQEIDSLSEYFNINVSEKEDGYVQISLDSGKILVDSTYVQMTRTSGSPYGGIGFQRVLQDGVLSNTTQVLNDEDLSSGSLGAMVQLRDENLPNLIAQLDNFAENLIEEFNNIHSQGSPVPPPNTLSGVALDNAGATLLTDIGLVSGTDFDISIVDADGNAVGTTAGLTYTGSVTGSTIADTTVGTFDPETYLSVNGENATIEGTATVQYNGSGVYQMTDPSGSVYTAVLSPNTYPVGASAATLTFDNGVTMNVDSGAAEPATGVIGTLDLNLTGGSVRIEDGDTLDDLVTKINSNSALNAYMTASVVDGALSITANNSTYGVVVGNDPTGSSFNKLGFNRYFEGSTASDISVSENILNDLNNIATARMSSDGDLTSTNNENAVALANLQNTEFSFDSAGGLSSQEATLTEYFISITSAFASEVSANEQSQEFNEALYDDFSARLVSITGVNTDEEFSNLIVYQRSYEASSKIIQTIDEMLETLINIL